MLSKYQRYDPFVASVYRHALRTIQAFSEICNFDNGQADNPETPADGSKYTMSNVLKNPKVVSHPSLG